MIRKVVILGRDAAAWLSANVLQGALGPTGLSVEVVALPSLLQAQDVYSSLPALEALHSQLRIDEHHLLKAIGGSYTLGQSFVGFGGAPFLHAYGSHGVPINRLPFFAHYSKARQMGLSVALEDFSLTGAAAKQGRFVVPDETTRTFGRTDYGYHLPAVAYVDYLRTKALKAGAIVKTARSAVAELDTTGNIAALVLGSGERVSGDLFIDASGAEALLLRSLEAGFDSWRYWFRGDRVLAASAAPYPSPPLYGRIEALDTGWLGLYPTQDRTRLVKVYDSTLIGDDAALQLAAKSAGLNLGDAVVSPLAPGRASQAWVKNCVAIGEAACVFDPIDSPALQAIQTGLIHLLALFPAQSDFEAERIEYNSLMQQAFEGIRDFQLVHSVCGRHAGAYWQTGDAVLPDRLTHKLDIFRARGIVPMHDEETFTLDSWEAVLTGHGVLPESYEPLVDATSDGELMGHLKQMLGYIREQVQSMTSHDAYLELFCK